MFLREPESAVNAPWIFLFWNKLSANEKKRLWFLSDQMIFLSPNQQSQNTARFVVENWTGSVCVDFVETRKDENSFDIVAKNRHRCRSNVERIIRIVFDMLLRHIAGVDWGLLYSSSHGVRGTTFPNQRSGPHWIPRIIFISVTGHLGRKSSDYMLVYGKSCISQCTTDNFFSGNRPPLRKLPPQWPSALRC